MVGLFTAVLPWGIIGEMPGAIVKIDGAKFRQFRLEKLMSQREIGELLELTDGRVRQVERSAPPVGVYLKSFRKFSAALGISAAELRQKIGVVESWDNNLQMSTMQRMQPIPMFDLAVAAGQWVEVGGEGIAPDLATFDRGVFRVRIAGDSMEHKYPNGSIVEFHLVQPDQDDVVPGRNYYWHRADNFATFKTLEKIEDETLTLRAINRKHYPKPLTASRQEIVRIAVARGIFIPDES